MQMMGILKLASFSFFEVSIMASIFLDTPRKTFDRALVSDWTSSRGISYLSIMDLGKN